MDREQQPPSGRYEEYAYVLSFELQARSSTIRGRDGIMITAVGEQRLTLLEILGVENSTFETGERIYIGKEGRTKVESVLGKIKYDMISQAAQNELAPIIEHIVTANEQRFVEYVNTAQPLMPRLHALELIPGIGKKYLRAMLEERERQKFESYEDLRERVGFKDPILNITKRIVEEITGNTRMNIFAKR